MWIQFLLSCSWLLSLCCFGERAELPFAIPMPTRKRGRKCPFPPPLRSDFKQPVNSCPSHGEGPRLRIHSTTDRTIGTRRTPKKAGRAHPWGAGQDPKTILNTLHARRTDRMTNRMAARRRRVTVRAKASRAIGKARSRPKKSNSTAANASIATVSQPCSHRGIASRRAVRFTGSNEPSGPRIARTVGSTIAAQQARKTRT